VPRLVSSRPLVAALAVVVALAAGACASDDDVSQEKFQADLQERTEIPDGVAACIADAVFADYDQAEINRIYRAATEDELGNDRRDELAAINERCFGEADTGEDASADEGSTTTTEG
jgi:hypothetical protein